MVNDPRTPRPYDELPGDPRDWLVMRNAQRTLRAFLTRARETHQSAAKRLDERRSTVTHFLHAGAERAGRPSFQRIARKILEADLSPGGVVLAGPPGEDAARQERFVHGEVLILRSLRQSDEPAAALYTLVGRCEHLLHWRACPERARLIHCALLAAAIHVEDPAPAVPVARARLEEVVDWVEELVAVVAQEEAGPEAPDRFVARSLHLSGYTLGCLGLALGRAELSVRGLARCLAGLAEPPAQPSSVREGLWENTLVLLERLRAAGGGAAATVQLGLLALEWVRAGQGAVVAQAIQDIHCPRILQRWWTDVRLNRLFDELTIELEDEPSDEPPPGEELDGDDLDIEMEDDR